MTKLTKYILIRLTVLVGIVYTVAFIAYKANADEIYTSGMLGVANSGKKSLAETKLLNLGYREPLIWGLSHQYEVGGWEDNVKQGRRGSGYAAYQIGVEAERGVLARVMAGPALITTPDSYLGGPFQFTEDFFLGFQGTNNNVVGIKYKHISSAGLEQPNMGRDFAGVELSLPF